MNAEEIIKVRNEAILAGIESMICFQEEERWNFKSDLAKAVVQGKIDGYREIISAIINRTI